MGLSGFLSYYPSQSRKFAKISRAPEKLGAVQLSTLNFQQSDRLNVERWTLKVERLVVALLLWGAWQTDVAKDALHWQPPNMNMAELMRELARLPAERQNELAAYLLHLRLQHDHAWRAEMTRRIDDQTPAQWVDLKDWRKELGSHGEK